MLDLIDLSFESIMNGSFLNELNDSRTNNTEVLTLEHLVTLNDLNDELEKFGAFESALLALEAKKLKTAIKKGIKPKKKLKKKKKVTREGYVVEVEGDIDGIEGIDYDLVYEDPEIDNIVSMEGELWDKIKDFFKTLWRKFVEMLKKFWNWLKGIFGGNKKKIEELERALSSRDQELKTMKDNEEKYKSEISERDSHIGNLTTRLADTEKELEASKQSNMLLQQNLDNTKKELDENIEKMNKLQEYTTQIEQKLNRHKKEIEELEKAYNINVQTNTIMSFVNDLKQMNSELNRIVSKDELNRRVDSIAIKIALGHQIKPEDLRINDIKAINDSMKKLEDDVKRITERAEAIEKTFNDVIKNLEVYKNDKNLKQVITADVTELKNYMKNVKKCISGVTRFISRYSKDLAEIHNKYVTYHKNLASATL